MPGRGPGRPPHPDVLTPAEQRVLEELRKGGTNVEIAVRLGLSPDTIKSHIASMLGKLNLNDRHALAAWRPGRGPGRSPALLALPPVLASLGPRLPWAGAVLGGGMVAVTIVVLVLVVLAEDEQELVRVPTAAGQCDAGAAVQDPDTNEELVGDCETLLDLRDRLAGKGALNWTAVRPMTEWTGVTIGGKPRRVTKLNLTSQGLTGEIPPAMGELTALTELRLDGNDLRGRIPSRLSLLTHLTDISLDGNNFKGCLPSDWRLLGSAHDFQSAGLEYCVPPEAVLLYTVNQQLEGGQSVGYQTFGRGPFLIVDLPEGHTFTVAPIMGEPIDPNVPPLLISVVITDEEGERSWLIFHPRTAEELYRRVVGDAPFTLAERRDGLTRRGRRGPEEDPLHEVFDEVAESAWPKAVVTCDAGVAVPDPATNPALVGDCESLLGLRDTLAGTGELNWTATRPMREWVGITIGGTPGRVTKLDLAKSGLDGQLSGHLGNLTGLKELHLDGNALGGTIPSKVALLAQLTLVLLAGNDLSGCLPPSIDRVPSSDLYRLTLPACDPPATLPSPNPVLASGTYKSAGQEAQPSMVFDVPEGARLEYVAGQGHRLLFRVVENGSLIIVDGNIPGVEWRHIAESNVGGPQSSSAVSLATLFELLGASVWLEE